MSKVEELERQIGRLKQGVLLKTKQNFKDSDIFIVIVDIMASLMVSGLLYFAFKKFFDQSPVSLIALIGVSLVAGFYSSLKRLIR